MKPVVSIIMPVKNAAKYLEICLESIQNQSFMDWELIAINDHSTDSSKALLMHYAEGDERIRWFTNHEMGIIPALQQAYADCQGKYVTRMDADDIMPLDRLELMVGEITEAPRKTIVTGLVEYFSDEAVSVGYQTYEKWLNTINLNHEQWPNIYRECVIASPNWMAAAEDLNAIKAFDALSYPEDYDLTFRWYENGFTIQTIPQVTLHWREHPDRTSRNSVHYEQEAFFRLKINAFIRMDYQDHPLILWGNNTKTRLTKNILKERNIRYKEMDFDNFQMIEQFSNPQLLIGVYPTSEEREKIEVYLGDISMKMGKDFWYL